MIKLTHRRRQQGFTLLEVLVAGFILFLVLTTATLVYRGALLTSGKAQNSLSMSSAVHLIKRVAVEQFREGVGVGDSGNDQYSGTGEHGQISYQWRAIMTHQGEPLAVLAEDALVAPNFKYSLWRIELHVHRGNLQRTYYFNELGW